METYDSTVGLLVEYVAGHIASTKPCFESSTFTIFLTALLIGVKILTFTLCSVDDDAAASFNNCITPIRSSRRNELAVGTNNNTSSLADFTKSMSNSFV